MTRAIRNFIDPFRRDSREAPVGEFHRREESSAERTRRKAQMVKDTMTKIQAAPNTVEYDRVALLADAVWKAADTALLLSRSGIHSMAMEAFIEEITEILEIEP